MKALLMAIALVAGFATQSFAGELDNDSAIANQQIPGTVVIRVNTRTKEVSALHTNAIMKNEVEAQALTSEKFEALPADKVRTELDNDGGASSWYYYNSCGYYGCGYNYNYVNWYGSWYQPCYYYNYGYYNYYYYGGWYW
jgi:hypothetical protein